MTGSPGTFLATVLLLASSGLRRSSSAAACPDPCACPRAPLLNCSSAGLSSVPRLLGDSVTELDLSRNLLRDVTFDRPHPNLRHVRLGDNGLARLSLCVGEPGPGRRSRLRRPGTRRGRGCESWAPGLQLLSVERNQLRRLPLGLEGSESLQVLQLSFNRISALRPGDLLHLRQLKELHLQHNLISSLHPQMFQDLAHLRVLDLSFNMLTSLHPLTFLTLRDIGADVRLGGNRWQCDCSMRSLRRRMAHDGGRGLQAWSVVCASPSALSGRDLLQLEEDELNCSAENGPELHRDVTVYRGSEILLSCAPRGSVWWTPDGEVSVSQPPAGLVISDIKETDTGLYVCVSEKHEVVSVFNLQISKVGGARRKTRSLPGTSRQIIPQGTPNRTGQERNQRATQSDLTLAVCLSVFITFLIAFMLGVLARPCIDVLWRRVTRKKSSSPTNSVPSVEQTQYDNEAFSNGEEPEHMGTRRERRVTFSTVDFREDNNEEYYDTVVTGNMECINNDAVIECEAAERDANRAVDPGSENCLRQNSPEDSQRNLSGFTDEGRTQTIDLEHIPDPVEQTRRSSSCSGSSLYDIEFNENKETQGDQSTLESRQLAEESVQQRADCPTPTQVEAPQLPIEGKRELSGFSTEPFADWSPYIKNTNQTDPDVWQENEEQFEFSDSVRSTSARSSGVCSSFNDSKRIVVPMFDEQKTDDSSSARSYVSEVEETQNTVNSDQAEVLERNLKQDVNIKQQIHDEGAIRPSVLFNHGDYRYETQRPALRPQDSSSSLSSDSDGEGYTVKKGLVTRLAVTSHSKSLNTGAPSLPAAYSSSSSIESEAEHNTCRLNEGIKINKPETLSTDLDRQYIHQSKRRVDIKTPLPTDQIQKQKHEMSMARLPSKVSQTVNSDPQTQWPVLDLERTIRIERRLDIKGPSPNSSSSSDSDDETRHHTEKPGMVDFAGPPVEVSQTGSQDPDTSWPALDLKQAMHIKRRLDIKAPSPPPDSFSSSDSDYETTDQIQKQKHEMSMARLPSKVSQTVNSDPQTQWPVLDLERSTRIKKRLDIKGPSHGSSSSSDSDDETRRYTEMPRNVDIAGPTFEESQTGSHDADTRWPALDLKQAMRIKRRLDIKAPSPPPDSSSSSDTENDTTDQIKKQKQEMSMARLPSKVSQTVSSDPQTQWPVLDLERSTRIKRRLDIKAPSPPPDSSSSSDTENETTHHTEKPGKVDIVGPPVQVFQTESHDQKTRWPALDLKQVMRIKRRLDIKGPSPNSSGSDSEVETLNANVELGLGVSAISKATETEFIILPKSRSPKTDCNINLEKYTVITDEDKTGGNISTTPEINPELQSRWATMNLGISRFRKRLEITSQTHDSTNLPSSPRPDSPTSSSSWSGTGSKSNITKEKKRGVGMQGRIKTESLLTPENTPVNVSLSLEGHGDISGNSVEVTERFRTDYSQPTTEGNPDTTLTGFGIPHYRRYLDIKGKEPPLQQLPDSSSSSSENEDASTKSAGEGWRKEASQNHSSLYVAQAVNIKPDQPQSQTELVQKKSGVELKSQTDSGQPHLSLTNIPRIRRALDIRAQRESSPSSSSEAETKGLSDPELSLGVPRVKRRLDVKAPLPTNYPGSESETYVTGSSSNPSRPASSLSGMTADDSLITYKRVILKTPSLPSNAFSVSGGDQTTDYKQRFMGMESVAQEGPSFAPNRFPSRISDDVVKKMSEQPRRITDADVPPEIRWMGVGRQLSDLSIPSMRRHLDVDLSSPPESELPPTDSSSSESNTKQDKGRAEVPLMPTYSSLGARSVSLPSSRALETLKAASEARNERKGLGALKAMSSERRKWDAMDENVALSASAHDYGLQGDTGFDYRKSEDEFKASTSRVTDLLYGGVPRYRRHDIGGTEPPQGAPPPIPATPPPYEGLTWRSPQRLNKQSGDTEESSLTFYSQFANENISEV